MTEIQQRVDEIARIAAELVPELTERLGRHGLGEIEVAHGDLRLRDTASAAPRAASASEGQLTDAAAPDASAPPAGRAERAANERALVGVASPAVGFFVYADGLGPGMGVGKGDALGHVEVLGVRHDVRAPRGGTVRNLVAETGEAVEYGQVVIEIEPAGSAR